MDTLLATSILMGLVMLLMSVGVMVSGRRLRGSCGGVSADCSCALAERRTCPRRKHGDGAPDRDSSG